MNRIEEFFNLFKNAGDLFKLIFGTSFSIRFLLGMNHFNHHQPLKNNIFWHNFSEYSFFCVLNIYCQSKEKEPEITTKIILKNKSSSQQQKHFKFSKNLAVSGFGIFLISFFTYLS